MKQMVSASSADWVFVDGLIMVTFKNLVPGEQKHFNINILQKKT